MAVRPRQRIKGDKRAAILRAATQEFSDRGFSAAGVDRIARRAHVNKALIYYYFGSKLALYREVVAVGIQALEERLSAVADSEARADEKIHRWVEELSAFLADHPMMTPLMLRELADGGRHFDVATLRRLLSILPMVVRIVEQGRDEGAFGDTDPLALRRPSRLDDALQRQRADSATREPARDRATPVDVTLCPLSPASRCPHAPQGRSSWPFERLTRRRAVARAVCSSLCSPALCRLLQPAATRRPRIACGSQVMSRPTTCRSRRKWAGASSSCGWRKAIA